MDATSEVVANISSGDRWFMTAFIIVLGSHAGMSYLMNTSLEGPGCEVRAEADGGGGSGAWSACVRQTWELTTTDILFRPGLRIVDP